MYVCSCIIAIVLYVVLCDWQERKAVADCQINNQSINQSIIAWVAVKFGINTMSVVLEMGKI